MGRLTIVGVAGAAVLLALMTQGCGGLGLSDKGSGSCASPFPVAVEPVRGSSVPGCEEAGGCWDPVVLKVTVGTTVKWSNTDISAHTITAGTPGDGPSGVFDSSLILPGKNFNHEFTAPGTYAYFCMVHPWMEGTVEVEPCK